MERERPGLEPPRGLDEGLIEVEAEVGRLFPGSSVLLLSLSGPLLLLRWLCASGLLRLPPCPAPSPSAPASPPGPAQGEAGRGREERVRREGESGQ